MAFNERLGFHRYRQKITQKNLGKAVGFPPRSADVRIAQYETGKRVPKDDVRKELAKALDISPLALSVPDIDTVSGLMHTLFALEDIYGLTPVIDEEEGIYLQFKPNRGYTENEYLVKLIRRWAIACEAYRYGAMAKEDYNSWRYQFPKDIPTDARWASILSSTNPISQVKDLTYLLDLVEEQNSKK